MRALAAAMLVTAIQLPDWNAWRTRVESWLYNPRERTEQGLTAAAEGDTDAAADRFDTARRISPPGDATAAYNAGTGRLLAERDGAVEPLRRAVEEGGPEIRAEALNNLGLAELAADDPAAAAETFRTLLRERPEHADAKHNLEVALRRLAEDKPMTRGEEDGPRGEESGERDSSQQPGADRPPEQEESPSPTDPGGESPDAGGESPESGSPEPGSPESGSDPRLPDFEPQPEMSQEQAAAILEAVENLEREERRRRAEERLRSRRRGDRDW